MRILSGIFSVVLPLVMSAQAMAHEEGTVGEIVTKELKLVYIDHVLSGAVGTTPVYAYPLPDQFGLTVQHHIGSEMFTSEFKKIDQNLTGKLLAKTKEGSNTEASIVVTGIEAAAGKIKGTLDADTFEVLVSSAEMNGNHYVNPHFEVKVGEKTYSFDLKNGQACIGCSVKIVYVVLGLLRVNGAI